MKKSVLHAFAGTGAIVLIATFWTSTLVSELCLGREAVVFVKYAIVHYGLFPLVLFIASVGASGFFIGKDRKGRLVEAKKKRMPIIAFNGLLVMLPSALFLNHKAGAGEFDSWFYAVQVIELAVGFVQLALLGMSFRDGLRLAGRLRTRSARPAEVPTETH